MTHATLSKNVGETVTLSCSLSETLTFPEWRGPPSLTSYTNLNDASGDLNPAVPAASEGRLEYASNNRDLILSDAVIGDSGDYRCTYTGLGFHTITLKVNPAPVEDDSLSAGTIAGIVIGSVGGAVLLVGGAIPAYFKQTSRPRAKIFAEQKL